MSLLRALLFALVLSAASAAPPLPPIMRIGELPGQKVPDLLQIKERNPFTRRETRVAEVKEDKESEESRLRALFAAMAVTGVVRGGGSVKALLGSLILKNGQPLPALIAGQTERLVVRCVTDTQIEIQFVEENERVEPRKILIPIDLRPRVAISPPELPPAPKAGSFPAGGSAAAP